MGLTSVSVLAAAAVLGLADSEHGRRASFWEGATFEERPSDPGSRGR